MDCHRYKWKNSFLILLLSGFLSQSAWADSVLKIDYQGKIKIAGEPYKGPGYFKFSLIDDPIVPTQNYWLNDDAEVSPGSEPQHATHIEITTEEFSIELGDTDYTNMGLIDVPQLDDSQHYLRVWFSIDDTNFEQLSPDHQLINESLELHTKTANTLSGAYIVSTTSVLAGTQKTADSIKTTALISSD